MNTSLGGIIYALNKHPEGLNHRDLADEVGGDYLQTYIQLTEGIAQGFFVIDHSGTVTTLILVGVDAAE